MSLYPIKFKPRYLKKMWGGRKIETVLGKTLPPGPIGESWELYDFPPGVVDDSADWISSEVADGPLAGKTLHELVGRFGRDLRGNVPLVGAEGQFPILIKFLDAGQDLSIQVHPDEAYAKANPGAHLKNEAWFIVQADAGSRLLKGLRSGVSRQSFAKAIADGSVESLIHSITAKPGDCFYLASGTVHALGAGILAAEVQTPSDTTFRVFDFNRIDPSTGKPRRLHIEQAMNCIDFSGGEPAKSPSEPDLVRCDYFSIRKVTSKRGQRISIPPGEPIVLMFIEGQARLSSADQQISTDAARGDTVLVPASLKGAVANAQSDGLWLEVRLGNSQNL
ncbi:MAG TPA: type I phosphomannose isomerase catalytic subunit [Tepidisphaeraceae bacterium]|jgi:mannose-6-phosphate isomerase|nr:type I phosphomannose isomerase catalytic subunit [Tepidisphaeraceae bacterium]